MRYLKKYIGIITGVLLGGFAGFLYWNFVGCASGQCMISSVWYNSTLYGAAFGGLIASSFTPKKNKVNEIS